MTEAMASGAYDNTLLNPAVLSEKLSFGAELQFDDNDDELPDLIAGAGDSTITDMDERTASGELMPVLFNSGNENGPETSFGDSLNNGDDEDDEEEEDDEEVDDEDEEEEEDDSEDPDLEGIADGDWLDQEMGDQLAGDIDEAEEDEEEEEEEEEEESEFEKGAKPDLLDEIQEEGTVTELVKTEEQLKNEQIQRMEDTINAVASAEPMDLQEDNTGTEGKADDVPKEKKKRKRKKKDETGKDKPKRKRKKKGEGDSSEKKKVESGVRRNIRKIIKESKLEKETLDAQTAELERQKRLAEQKKALQASVAAEEEKAKEKEKDKQLKSLLQAAEEEAEKESKKEAKDIEKDKEKAEIAVKVEEKEIKKEKKPIPIVRELPVIDISSDEEDEEDEDDEDCVMVNSDEEEEEDDDECEEVAEAEDPNNSGSHINDAYNCKDSDGRVLVNVGHSPADEDIFLPKNVATAIKPHQIGGVRFLYDNLVESLSRFKSSNGFGCILAHSMGLGKTIQVIGFIDIFLRHTGAKHVLVIVPINTLANWMAEFNMWVPDKAHLDAQGIPEEEVSPRPYNVYLLNDTHKTTAARAKVVEEWNKKGGVIILGYEMYRLLSSKKAHIQKPKKKKKDPNSDVIDVDEEDLNKTLLVGVHSALVNPGPDLIVCDEGHRIKNSHAGISMSLKNIKTKRRIVLTGYPLQNNLVEYWCMVDFVRPNFLGTKTEFSNMFERPIMNGQCADSTPQDVRLMRYRAHVLHSLLEGFVQRRGHTVLQAALPLKQEFVFMVRMSPIQKKLYEEFMESVNETQQNGWVNNNPLKAFAVCCKIWNHPDILYTCMRKSSGIDDDLDIETDTNKKKAGGRSRTKKTEPPPMDVDGAMGPTPPPSVKNTEPAITYDWANEIMKDYVPGLPENGGKMVLLLRLLEESLAMDDKILVFSQSLFTLNLIEEFLSKQKVPRPDMDEYWCRNKSYFRLDGSTSSTEREKLIVSFNDQTNLRTWLFMLSTRAGSLGVNLVGANRVIVMDASWNPCHDCQAICRVYRFGQEKPSFIYRLVTENTMERKIYDRQVNKQGMSDRVIDELNPQNNFRRDHVDKLLSYQDKEFDEQDFSTSEEKFADVAMVNVLKSDGKWLTDSPFTHESLLIDRKELKLTIKEKRLAKQSYVMEKRLNVSYSRPSYAAYYPRNANAPYQGIIRARGIQINRPVASVKPMISTPVPMKPKVVTAPQVLKPGVSVHQVLTTTAIVLPGTNTSTDSGAPPQPKKIPAGQQVLVIRTPKGVYIRTPDGKIFAVRSKPPANPTTPLDKLASTGSESHITVVRPSLVNNKSIIQMRPPSGTVITTQSPSMTTVAVTSTTTVTVAASSNSTSAADLLSSIYTQSQKVNSLIKGSSQVKVVGMATDGKQDGATSTSVSPLSALQSFTGAPKAVKIISRSPNFSGGTISTKKVQPKTIIRVGLPPDKLKASSPAAASSENSSDSKSSSSVSPKPEASQASENDLPPINLEAIRLPFAGQMPDDVQDASSNTSKSSSTPSPGTSVAQDQANKNKPSAASSDSAQQNLVPSVSAAPVLPESHAGKQQTETASQAYSQQKSSVSLEKKTDNQSPQLPQSSMAVPPARPVLAPSQKSGTTSQFWSPGIPSSQLPQRPSDIDLKALQITDQNASMSQRPSDIDLKSLQLSDQNGGNMSQRPSDINLQSLHLFDSTPQPPAYDSFSSKPAPVSSQTPLPATENPSQVKFSLMNEDSGLGTRSGSESGSFMGSQTQLSSMNTNQNSNTSYSDLPNTDTDLMSLTDFGNSQSNTSFLSELNFTDSSEVDNNFLSSFTSPQNSVNSMSGMNPMSGFNSGYNTGYQGYQGSNSMGQSNQNYNMGMMGFGNQQGTNFDTPTYQGFGNAHGSYNMPNFSSGIHGNQSHQATGMAQQGFNTPQGQSGMYSGMQSGAMGNPMGMPMQPGMYRYPSFSHYPYPPAVPQWPYFPMPYPNQYGQGGNVNMPMPQGDAMGQPLNPSKQIPNQDNSAP